MSSYPLLLCGPGVRRAMGQASIQYLRLQRTGERKTLQSIKQRGRTSLMARVHCISTPVVSYESDIQRRMIRAPQSLHNSRHTFNGNLPTQHSFGARQLETEAPKGSENGVVRAETEKGELRKRWSRLLRVAPLCGQVTRTMFSPQI